MYDQEFGKYLRLLVPALLVWVAWAVLWTPHQRRANRLFAAFLFLVSLGFLIEIAWLITYDMPRISLPVRQAQFLVGLADPPVLLAYALNVPRPHRWWRPRLLVAVYGAAALVQAYVLLEAGTPEPRWPLQEWSSLAYVNGTYLAAFLILVHTWLGEDRRFLERQLFFAAVGTGFVATSRTVAFTTGAWAEIWPAGTPMQTVAQSAVISLAMAGLLWIGLLLVRPASRPRINRLFAVLVLWLGFFFAAWAILVKLLRPEPDEPIVGAFYALRWIFFALLLGYGILRYQLFDFAAERWKTFSYLGSALVGVMVAAAASDAIIESGRVPAARVLAPVAGLAATATLYGVLAFARRTAQLRRPGPTRSAVLDLYESALQSASNPDALTDPERRLVETLRDILEITPAEHQQILARMPGRVR